MQITGPQARNSFHFCRCVQYVRKQKTLRSWFIFIEPVVSSFIYLARSTLVNYSIKRFLITKTVTETVVRILMSKQLVCLYATVMFLCHPLASRRVTELGRSIKVAQVRLSLSWERGLLLLSPPIPTLERIEYNIHVQSNKLRAIAYSKNISLHNTVKSRDEMQSIANNGLFVSKYNHQKFIVVYKMFYVVLL
jgi:hypothetical protein